MALKKENQSLGVLLYDSMKQKIIDGGYQNGESLIEQKLSLEYGVSRTPIREALHRLEREGLVRIVPNKGAVVSGVTESEIGDVYNIRMRIESMAAYLAAENRTEEQLKELEEAVELFEFYVAKGNDGQMSETDFRFHDVIYAASHSRPIQNILSGLHNYIKRVRRKSLSIPGRAQSALAEHKGILEAIRARDGFRAQELTYQHIRNAARLNHFEGLPPPHGGDYIESGGN